MKCAGFILTHDLCDLGLLSCFCCWFSHMRYALDLLPLHFHFLRERLFGLLGSDFQSPLIFADRAQ